MSPRNRPPRLAAMLVLIVIAALLLGGVLPALSASLSSQPPPPEMESISDAAILPRLVLVADPNPAPEPRIILAPQEQDGVERVQNATIEVNYGPYFPLAAQSAFESAIKLWESWISSQVTIVIDANWGLLDPGVLASSGPLRVVMNFPNRPVGNTWYYVALANKLRGADNYPGIADIGITFTSSPTIDWYYGIGGPIRSDQYDFISVALHEIAHGLGFGGSMRVGQDKNGYGCINTTVGCWGFGTNFPAIYDRFARSGGTPLTDFQNNSLPLAAQLTGGNLTFNSSSAVVANGGIPPQLHAPATWASGSSYSHLGEFFKYSQNRMMTFSVRAGDVIHLPGDIALAMLADMGWAADDPAPTPTHTPTVTRTPTPRYTPTPTNTPSVWRHLPVIEYRFDRGYSISGSLRYNGNPISGITVTLQKETAAHVETLVASTTTDSTGNYRFNNPPVLAAGDSYYVQFQNNSLNENYLWSWRTPRTWSGVTGPVTYAPFDIADVTLLTPLDAAEVNFPATFTWQPRLDVISDNYEFDVYDLTDFNPWYASPALNYVGQYALTSLPVDNINNDPAPFATGVPYFWEVWIYGPDGGYGVSLKYRQVTFGPARQAVTLSAIDIQRLVEQSRRQRMDIRR